MSVLYLAPAWGIRLESHTDKLLLIALADNCSDEGECFPSIATLALKCDMAESGVKVAIKRMVAKGFIQIERRKRKNGSDTSNQYLLVCLEEAAQVLRNMRGHGVTPPHKTRGHGMTPGGHGVTPRGHAVAPLEPLLEPSSNRLLVPEEAQTAVAVAPSFEQLPGSSAPWPDGEPPTVTAKPDKGVTVAHAQFIALWMEAWHKRFDDKYEMVRGRDHKAAQTIVNGSKRPVEDLIEVAKAAWERIGEYPFKSALSMAGFNSKFSEIKACLTLPARNGNGRHKPEARERREVIDNIPRL